MNPEQAEKMNEKNAFFNAFIATEIDSDESESITGNNENQADRLMEIDEVLSETGNEDGDENEDENVNEGNLDEEIITDAEENEDENAIHGNLVEAAISGDEENSDSGEIFAIISDNENDQGECVGFDGDSDRSEEEEMNEQDREFLDDESETYTENVSHLSLLNARRYDDDEIVLDR